MNERAVMKVTRHFDGRVTIVNLTTGEEDDLEPGTSITYSANGCFTTVLALVAGVFIFLALL